MSRFNQGHDSKARGLINKIKEGKESPDALPVVLIKAAQNYPGLKVLPYTAEDILELSKLRTVSSSSP